MQSIKPKAEEAKEEPQPKSQWVVAPPPKQSAWNLVPPKTTSSSPAPMSYLSSGRALSSPCTLAQQQQILNDNRPKSIVDSVLAFSRALITTPRRSELEQLSSLRYIAEYQEAINLKIDAGIQVVRAINFLRILAPNKPPKIVLAAMFQQTCTH